MLKNLIYLSVIRDGAFGDFIWIDEFQSNDELKYGLLCVSLLLFQVIIIYEILISYGECTFYAHDVSETESVKDFIIRYNITKVSPSYLLERFYHYLFIFYFFELILFIYPFYINLPNRVISIILILITLFLSIFGRLLGHYLDDSLEFNALARLRLKLLEQHILDLKLEETALKEYHIRTYGQIFQDIVDEEIKKKYDAKQRQLERDLFETTFEELEIDESKSMLDLIFYPGRLHNFTIVLCIVLILIISGEDYNLYQIFWADHQNFKEVIYLSKEKFNPNK